MPVAHKTAISFGLVHIPVGLYTATQDDDVRFNYLCREDNSRVRYKKVCAGCGKEVSAKDIVKGFEYEDGKYVVVTDADFEKIKTQRDKSISILQFAAVDTIPPIYFDKTYHVVPEKGGEKAFELLREAMMGENKVAVARTVMGSRDTLMAVMATADGLLAETLFFASEIKELPRGYARPEVESRELQVARTLIDSMDRPFDPKEYRDEYQERLRDLIQKKINGRRVVAPREEKQGGVIDLMEALQASLKQQKKPAVRKNKPDAQRAPRKKGA